MKRQGRKRRGLSSELLARSAKRRKMNVFKPSNGIRIAPGMQCMVDEYVDALIKDFDRRLKNE